MTQLTLNIPLSIQERDKGIQKAVTSAETANPGWKDKAYEFFKSWLSKWATGHRFLMEDFRLSAEIHGLPQPPSNRAYGGLAVKAKFEGLIVSDGTKKVSNPKAHRANAALWRKV